MGAINGASDSASDEGRPELMFKLSGATHEDKRSRGTLVKLTGALVAMLLGADITLAATRGISVSVRQSEAIDAPVAGEVQLYQSSYALVIGNDAYNNGWPLPVHPGPPTA